MNISKKLKIMIATPIVLMVGAFGYLMYENYVEYNELTIFKKSVEQSIYI